MHVAQRTQVGIVGAGPAGLLLSHLLALAGVDSIVVENRSQAYCEARQRAGVLESTTVELLRTVGLGARLDTEGIEHDGLYLQFAGERHHIDFRKLSGRGITFYAQTEVVKDLIAARRSAAAALEFEVSDVAVADLDSERPVLRYIDSAGVQHEVTCEAIAGCDGVHGICRQSIPRGLARATGRTYPYAWLGILAAVPPSSDQAIYCRHENGFACHSFRTPEISRLYLQAVADEDIARWPDERIWEELRHRMAVPGWELRDGPVLQKSITEIRSFVVEPMRYGRLFLAGDAAHIVPPTGARGLNLAVGDVAALATALISLLRDGRPDLADCYSNHRMERVWQATHLSCSLTSMLHVAPDQDRFESALQLAQLRNLVTSQAAATAFAESYAGYAPLRYDPLAGLRTF